MALPQQNAKRLLAYSGIAHIGYMLVGLAAASASGMAMVLFYLVAYVFGNMGAFLVVEAVARPRARAHGRPSGARPALARCSRWRCCCSCSRWAASRSWPASGPSSTCSGRRPSGPLLAGAAGAVLTVVALFYYLVVAKRMYIEAPDAPGRSCRGAHAGAGRRSSAPGRGGARRLSEAGRDGAQRLRVAAPLF